MEKTIVFGAGEQCEKFYQAGYFKKSEIVALVDNDKNKWGGVFCNKEIESPETGLKKEYDKVLILCVSDKGNKEIKQQLIQDFHVPEEKVITGKDIYKNIYAKLIESGVLLRMHSGFAFDIQRAKVSHGDETVKDDTLVKRIITAYNESVKHFENDVDSWWTNGYLWKAKADMHDKLISWNHEEVKKVLRNPAMNRFLWGYDDTMLNEVTSDNYIDYKSTMIFDNIIQLAAILGLIRMPNPEPGIFRSPVVDIDDVLDKIAERMGFDLKFPNPYPGEIGLHTRRGIINYRAVQALYQAYKIKSLLHGNINNARILEIGAGLGRTGYYLHEMGLKDYTIIDIPMTNVAQAYFLGRTIGEEKIVLNGEKKDGEIKILPAYMIGEQKQKYDLILNADSITEMDEASQKVYWDYIKTHTDIFLSINHEVNEHMVKEYYEGTDLDVDRHLYPMRRGYLEEIIRF